MTVTLAIVLNIGGTEEIHCGVVDQFAAIVLLVSWIFLESSVFTGSVVLQDVILQGFTHVLCGSPTVELTVFHCAQLKGL